MMIENCAEIMERRAFTKPQLCEMSNSKSPSYILRPQTPSLLQCIAMSNTGDVEFFTLLHCFPGVLFLLPGNVADQDPMWEKLSFVTVHVDR